MSRIIRVFVAVSVRLCREGLADILGRVPTFDVVGVSGVGSEIKAQIVDAQPDVVVLEMATPHSHAVARDLHLQYPNLSIVALGVGESDADAMACAEVGITGYLTPEMTIDQLVHIVTSAAQGEMVCSPKMADRLVRKLAALTADRQPESPQARLTPREAEIVLLLEKNFSNKEIAVALGIEVATVKNHVHNVLEKLSVHRRSDIARLFGRVRTVTLDAQAPPRDRRSVG